MRKSGLDRFSFKLFKKTRSSVFYYNGGSEVSGPVSTVAAATGSLPRRLRRSKKVENSGYTKGLKKKIITRRSKFSALTKKQKQRIRLNKANKLLYTSSGMFRVLRGCPRFSTVTSLFIGRKFLVHDGYSWHVLGFSPDHLRFKAGALCYATRALSRVPLEKKGKIFPMAQKSTSKIKRLKTKRKK